MATRGRPQIWFFDDGIHDPEDDMQKYKGDSLIVAHPYEIEGSW